MYIQTWLLQQFAFWPAWVWIEEITGHSKFRHALSLDKICLAYYSSAEKFTLAYSE